MDGKSWKVQEITKQVEISRSLYGNWSMGNIFFSMNALSTNRQGIYNTLKSSVYPQPALAPKMGWRDAIPPLPPTNLEVKNRQLSWKAANDKDVRSWTLYKQNGGTWTLEQILSGTTRMITIEPGNYALCTVDSMANESAGVLISVS